MRTARAFVSALYALVFIVGNCASAGEIYNNIDPEADFGYIGAFVGKGGGYDFVSAVQFTARQTGDVRSIEAIFLTYQPSTVTLTIHTDENGRPGTQLESVQLDTRATVFPVIVGAQAGGATRLEAGTEYWLLASQEDQGTAYWYHNNTGDTGRRLTYRDGQIFYDGTSPRVGFRISSDRYVPPTNYGLFIGANHPNDGALFRFDRNAQDMAFAFDARPNTVVEILTGDTDQDPIRVEDIEQTLERLRRIMRGGDSLTLYINNHGDSAKFLPNGNREEFNGMGIGDEAIYLGGLLFDNDLGAMLRDFDGFRVTVFLDTCHGGGFWGGTDPNEHAPPGAGFNDLNSLNNIALYAAAPEHLEGYGVGRRTFWGRALLEAFEAPRSWSPSGLAAHLNERTSSLARTWDKTQYPVWYTAGYGDPVNPDMSLIETFSDHSVDYDFEGTLFDGPELEGLFSELLELVEGVGPGKSLWDKVSGAQTYFEADNIYAACEKLNALMNQVAAQAGKKIPTVRATSIQAHTKFAMSALECAHQL